MARRVAKSAAVVEVDVPPARAHAAPVVSTLEGVIGHAGPKRTLAAAMQAGRLHHAWIFHGPAGVGKFTTAVAFAATILDPTTAPGLTGELAPEADSPVQQLVRAGTHPDLHIIRKELAAVSRHDQIRRQKQTTIAKAVIEEFLIEPAAKTAMLRGESMASKVFIIDEADLLDASGQNTLLKTLEEPSPGTVIVLVTAFPDDLLPTIRSRCQRIGFAPLADDDMLAWLGTGVLEIPPEQRDWALRFAAGSPGAAMLAVRHNLYTWHESVAPMLDAALQGRYVIDLGPTMHKLVEEQAAAAAAADKNASKDAANKQWGRRMLAYVAEHARGRLRARAAGTPKLSAAQLEVDPLAQRAMNAVEASHRALVYLESHVKLDTVFENLSAQIAAEPAPV
ncbi:MAG: AAA family ATPase [Phycisphaeraceae bacterium]|nr:AAA family ATPase [Phycisphaeraceae bacterium]